MPLGRIRMRNRCCWNYHLRMADTSYYVYALKDPRSTPALPFYVGKGTGTRSFDHLVKPDQTRKGLRIQEIESSGFKVLVTASLTHSASIRPFDWKRNSSPPLGPSTQAAC